MLSDNMTSFQHDKNSFYIRFVAKGTCVVKPLLTTLMIAQGQSIAWCPYSIVSLARPNKMAATKILSTDISLNNTYSSQPTLHWHLLSVVRGRYKMSGHSALLVLAPASLLIGRKQDRAARLQPIRIYARAQWHENVRCSVTRCQGFYALEAKAVLLKNHLK